MNTNFTDIYDESFRETKQLIVPQNVLPKLSFPVQAIGLLYNPSFIYVMLLSFCYSNALQEN